MKKQLILKQLDTKIKNITDMFGCQRNKLWVHLESLTQI